MRMKGIRKWVSSNGNGKDVRIVNKRVRLTALHFVHVTLADNRNGLRRPYLNLNTK